MLQVTSKEENLCLGDDNASSSSSSSSNCSINTNDAFLEMLGLPEECYSGDFNEEENYENISNCNLIASDEDHKIENCGIVDKHHCEKGYRNIPKWSRIDLPKHCSRHLLSPNSCLAIVLDDVVSPQDCQRLIQLAHEGGQRHRENIKVDDVDGFRYITEATHRSLDGSSYTVQIQNPNPHKLAALDTGHSPFRDNYRAQENENSRHTQNVNGADNTADSFNSRKGAKCKDFPTMLLDNLYNAIEEALEVHTQPNFESFQSRTSCGHPLGLNPRMRILKYDAKDDDRFDPHFDATTEIDVEYGDDRNTKKMKSLITVLVYLNDGDGVDFEGGETLYLNYSTSTSTAAVSKFYDSAPKHGKYTGNISTCLTKVVPKMGRVVLFEHDLYHSGAPLVTGTKYVMRTDVLFHDKRNEMLELKDQSKFNCSAISRGEVDETKQKCNDNVLFSDLCQNLEISLSNLKILQDMGLLNITCESFLSPGIVLLKDMLVDSGVNATIADHLIDGAISVVHKSDIHL